MENLAKNRGTKKTGDKRDAVRVFLQLFSVICTGIRNNVTDSPDWCVLFSLIRRILRNPSVSFFKREKMEIIGCVSNC